MKELGIDIETYSSVELADCGVYRYVEAEDFAVLLFGYSVDGAPAVCVDLAAGEQLPPEILDALTDPAIIKTAFNAAFERVCLGRWLGRRLDPAQWRCTMVRAARLGLPLSLGQCAEVLGLPEGKMTEGRALIRFFSKPGAHGVRHTDADAPDRWETFKEYNRRDVDVEQAILARTRFLAVTAAEVELYTADQEINDRGVLIDRVLVDAAARFDEDYKAELLDEARRLTGLDNPNSPAQIKVYLHRLTGRTYSSLGKKSLDEIERELAAYPEAKRLLRLRRELGKTSNKKYAAMQGCVCADGRIHGLLQFHGAARTGRWAGRLVQVQNLPQNHLPDLDRARRLVRAGDLEDFEFNYADVSQTLSELIRTAFVAAPGHIFHVCDFSAIEARVIAWLAGESWVLDVFRQGGDIYCSTASKMFGVPVEKHGANAHLRQKGKIAVLALGYGGGVPALEAMGGARLGLGDREMQQTVKLWRAANPRIVDLWAYMERAAVAAIKTGRVVAIQRGVTMSFAHEALVVTLPSGRAIYYPRAAVVTEYTARGEREQVQYEGLNQVTKKREKIRTYGGKLTENVVQAIARDILGEVLLRARAADLPVVFHIHDEIVVEAPRDRALEEVCELFNRAPWWCPDLPLRGAGYSTPYYLKD